MNAMQTKPTLDTEDAIHTTPNCRPWCERVIDLLDPAAPPLVVDPDDDSPNGVVTVEDVRQWLAQPWARELEEDFPEQYRCAFTADEIAAFAPDETSNGAPLARAA